MATKTHGYTWGAWQATSLAATVVNSGQSADATAIDLAATVPGVVGCEASIVAVYSAHAFVSGGNVYVRRQIESTGPTYEAIVDSPWAFSLLYGNGVTRNRVFFVDPRTMRNFLLSVDCPTLANASITYTVRYRTCTLKTQ
jgi:hypothetical protein